METDDGSPVERIGNPNLELKCHACQLGYPRMYRYYDLIWCTAPRKLCRVKVAEAKKAQIDPDSLPAEGSYSGQITAKILAGKKD
jgi:hypothetical protein